MFEGHVSSLETGKIFCWIKKKFELEKISQNHTLKSAKPQACRHYVKSVMLHHPGLKMLNTQNLTIKSSELSKGCTSKQFKE